jgi:hypothetical protein
MYAIRASHRRFPAPGARVGVARARSGHCKALAVKADTVITWQSCHEITVTDGKRLPCRSRGPIRSRHISVLSGIGGLPSGWIADLHQA